MTAPGAPKRRLIDLVFDLRGTVAVLFVIYGVVCIVWGLAFSSTSERARAGGINVNLWAGIGMLAFAVLMGVWVVATPEEAPNEPTGEPPD